MSEGRKDDGEKSRVDLIPPEALFMMGDVLRYGAEKYSANNWKIVCNAEERYYAAALRHLLLHRSGEKFDRESGLPHLAHAATNLIFLLYFFHHEGENHDQGRDQEVGA